MAVDLDRAKAHLGIDWAMAADQSALLNAYLSAAIAAVENRAQTLLTERAVTQRLDSLTDRHGRSIVRLEWGPVVSVEGIDYLDADGVSATLLEADGEFRIVEGVPTLLLPPVDEAWPVPHCSPGAVTIRYTAGYGGSGPSAAGDAPGDLDAAVLLMVGHLWHNREAIYTGIGQPDEVPLGVTALCNPYRHSLI